MKPLVDFRSISGFKKQRQRFDEVGAGFFKAVALAGDVQFRAQGHIPVSFALDDGGQAA